MTNYETDDLRISGIVEVPSPASLCEDYPITETAAKTVNEARQASHKI